ncbi:MAG: class I SAM-dependent methyltransferase [Acidimicrobiales bacterium]
MSGPAGSGGEPPGDRSAPVSPEVFYSRLAPTYREAFEVPHRKAYDRLAWDAVTGLLPPSSLVVDVGCGVGRWASALVERGHRVIGVEPSPGMAAAARVASLGPQFTLHQATVDEVRLDPGRADAVIAMGSVQYAPDPVASIARMATWLRPGGRLWVLVDSLGGLVAELARRGDHAQAVIRARTATARLALGSYTVEHHLFDAAGLERALDAAGLVEVTVSGLLVGWNSKDRDTAQRDLIDHWDAALDRERALAAVRGVADLGKQLLATGRRP